MAVDVAEIRKIVGAPLEIPSSFDSYFDEEADVLYVTFERAVEDDSDFTDDDIVLRYREKRLLSVTILHASKRAGLHIDS